jgi:uncharacterized surface protein with fasciclin (FAS1) repeats
MVIFIFSISIFADSQESRDIVDTAVSAGNFATLLAAVKAAGLVETLKGEGPFTVFAPTDEAFAKLSDGTIEDLLKPQNKERLIAILTYHVVSGKYTSDKVQKSDLIETVNGQNIEVNQTDKGLKVNQSMISATDIITSNGIIHVIDTVLMPKDNYSSAASECNFIQIARAHGCPAFSKEKTAVKESRQESTLLQL